MVIPPDGGERVAVLTVAKILLAPVGHRTRSPVGLTVLEARTRRKT